MMSLDQFYVRFVLQKVVISLICYMKYENQSILHTHADESLVKIISLQNKIKCLHTASESREIDN